MIKLKRSINKILQSIKTAQLTKLLLHNEKLFNILTSTSILQVDDQKLFFSYIEDADDVLSNLFSQIKSLELTSTQNNIDEYTKGYGDLSTLQTIGFQGSYSYFQTLLQDVIITQQRIEDDNFIISIRCRFYNDDPEKIAQCLFIPSVNYRKRVEQLQINFSLSKYAKHALYTYSGLKDLKLIINDDNNHVVDLPLSQTMEKFSLVKQLINTFEIIDLYTSYPNLQYLCISCSVIQHLDLNFSKQILNLQGKQNRLNQDIHLKLSQVMQIMQHEGCLQSFNFFSISEIPVDLFILMISNQPKINSIFVSSQLVQSSYTIQNFEKLQNWLNPKIFQQLKNLYSLNPVQEQFRDSQIVDDQIFSLDTFNQKYIYQQKATNNQDQIQKTQWNIPQRSSFVINDETIQNQYFNQHHDSIFHKSQKQNTKQRTNSHSLMYEKMMKLTANESIESNTEESIQSVSDLYSSQSDYSSYDSSQSEDSIITKQNKKKHVHYIHQQSTTQLKITKQTPILDDNQVQNVRRSSFIEDNQDILANWTMDTNIEVPVSESFVTYSKPISQNQNTVEDSYESSPQQKLSMSKFVNSSTNSEHYDDSSIVDETIIFAHDDTKYHQRKNKKIIKRSWSAIQFFSQEKSQQHFIFQKGVQQFINVYLRNEKQQLIKSLLVQLPFCKISQIPNTRVIFNKLINEKCIRQDKKDKYCQKSIKQLRELINDQDIFFNTIEIDQEFEFSLVQDFTDEERQHTLRDEKQEFQDQYFTFDNFQQNNFDHFYDKVTEDNQRIQNSIVNVTNNHDRHMSVIPNIRAANFLTMNLPDKIFGITLNKHKFQFKNEETSDNDEQLEQSTTATQLSVLLFILSIPEATEELILLQILFSEFTFKFLLNHLQCLSFLKIQEIPLISSSICSSSSVKKLSLLDQGYLSIQILDETFPNLVEFEAQNLFLDNDILRQMNLQVINIQDSPNLSKDALKQFIQGNQFSLQFLLLDNCPIPFIECQMNKLETFNCKNIIYSYSEYQINSLSLGHLDFIQLILLSPNIQTACYNQCIEQYQGIYDYQYQFNILNSHYCSQLVSVQVDQPLLQVIKKFVSRECNILLYE